PAQDCRTRASPSSVAALAAAGPEPLEHVGRGKHRRGLAPECGDDRAQRASQRPSDASAFGPHGNACMNSLPRTKGFAATLVCALSCAEFMVRPAPFAPIAGSPPTRRGAYFWIIESQAPPSMN